MEDVNRIVWFREDLRLHDHEPLVKAIEAGGNIIPVYILDSSLLEETETGESLRGAFQLQFLIESIQNLRQSLRSAGSELIFRFGDPREVLPELARELKVREVYTAESPHSIGAELERELEKSLWTAKIELKTYWHYTLYHINDIPWPIHRLPGTFTHFRKESEKSVEVRELYQSPEKIDTSVPHDLEVGVIPSVVDMGLSRPQYDERSVLKFRGGEKAALDRLNQYVWEQDLLKVYKKTRNGLIGADYSSKFSAWLAHGCISPRFILKEIRKYESERTKNSSTYWLFFELLWRDYFQFVARQNGEKIFDTGGIKQRILDLNDDMNAFSKWKNGQTGIPFIDANMRELNLTGFMSNRGRQNVASFLVHDLKVNWTWGALYFENKLIDYDACSNWCNWNYVAGVGNDPREDRYFNTMSQAKTYDGKGEYVKLWIPELKKLPSSEIHHPFKQPETEEREPSGIESSYPDPIVPFKKWL